MNGHRVARNARAGKGAKGDFDVQLPPLLGFVDFRKTQAKDSMERNPLAPAAHHNIVDLTGESETSGKMPSKSWMPSEISEGKQG